MLEKTKADGGWRIVDGGSRMVDRVSQIAECEQSMIAAECGFVLAAICHLPSSIQHRVVGGLSLTAAPFFPSIAGPTRQTNVLSFHESSRSPQVGDGCYGGVRGGALH
jgi:hypothetical protein